MKRLEERSHWLPEDGKAWALRKAQKHNNVEVPVGEKCADCYQLHSTSFSYLTWQQFSQPGEELAGCIEKARKHMFEGGAQDWCPASIQQEKAVVVELSKKLIVMTEKDLRKSMGLTKLSKKLMSGVPSVWLSTDTGSLEEHWVFQHPSQGQKELTLKSLQHLACLDHCLQPADVPRAGQAGKTWQAKLQTLTSDQGLASLFKDEKLVTFEQLASKKDLAEDVGAAAVGAQQAQSTADSDEDSDAPLVGPAASAPLTWSEKKQKKTKSSIGSQVGSKGLGRAPSVEFDGASVVTSVDSSSATGRWEYCLKTSSVSSS